MTGSALAVVVLAAGKSTRMISDKPKVLHHLAGKPMLLHVLDSVSALSPRQITVVVGPDMQDVVAAAAPHPTVVQPQALGTGDAVRCALAGLHENLTDVLIAFGDTPLLKQETLATMLALRHGSNGSENKPKVVLLGFRPADPTGYGRILRDADGQPARIVEERDASEAERQEGLCNAGIVLVDAKALPVLLTQLENANVKGEFYLTDVVALARTAGWRCAYAEANTEEVMGVNSRGEQAQAEAVMQRRLRAAALARGATLVDPQSVWLSHDTKLDRDVTVHPNVVFGLGVEVAEGAEINSFCHLEGVQVGPRARIGPFARLRPGSVVGEEARVGNFVEVKNAIFGPGAKANHLSYIGDATVGAKANIGAGTITCNYDGFAKHHTKIGRGAFVGSNTSLIAPVTVGPRSIVGAGSTIDQNVPQDAIVSTRGNRRQAEGAAVRYRYRRMRKKQE